MGHIGHMLKQTCKLSLKKQQDDKIMIFLPGPRKAVNRVLEAADGSFFSAFPGPRARGGKRLVTLWLACTRFVDFCLALTSIYLKYWKIDLYKSSLRFIQHWGYPPLNYSIHHDLLECAPWFSQVTFALRKARILAFRRSRTCNPQSFHVVICWVSMVQISIYILAKPWGMSHSYNFRTSVVCCKVEDINQPAKCHVFVAGLCAMSNLAWHCKYLEMVRTCSSGFQ